MTRTVDITTPARSEDVPRHLAALSARCTALANQIRERLERTDRTVAFANFCMYVGGELRRLSMFYPANVPGLAWATRNLFEVNLIVRHVLVSDDNLQRWLGQLLQDEKEFIEGILSVSSDQPRNTNHEQLNSRLNGLQDMSRRHDLQFAKPFRTQTIAESLGMSDEYIGLYKLFSKYVHPSSLLVNAWYSQEPDFTWLDLFVVKAQVYAGDTIQRLASACRLEA
mgnify:CR=1 FL=1